MSKLVIELQKACVNPTLSYADLFQKAYFIARKLEQKEMIDFLRKEIDGYKKEREVPDFRYIDVIFKAMNELRISVDEAEVITDRKYWPYPSYGELLFSVR